MTDVTAVESPITGPTDQDAVRASVSELNRKREQEGTLAVDDGPIERRYHANDESPKTLRQVTRDISDVHRDESDEIRFASETFGVPAAQLRETTKDPDWVAQQRPDWNPAQVSEYVRTGAMPPEPVGVATNAGKIHTKIDDMSPLIGDRAGAQQTGTLREVTRAVTNFREAAALHQQQELAELQAQYSQQQAALVEQQAQPAQQATQPTPQPQPQQPDPVQIERQRLEMGRRIAAELKQLSIGEAKAFHELNNLDAQWNSIPEVRDRNALNETYARNPGRYQQLQQAQRDYQQRKAALTNEFNRHYQSRTTREAQIAYAHQKETEAAVQNYNSQEDAKFQKWFKQTYPKESLSDVSKFTRQAWVSAGVPDQRINELWRSGALRGVEVQQVLAKAGLYEMQQAQQQQRRNEIETKKATLPQVLKPGVFRPRGADHDSDIYRLQRELEEASGEKALKLAARLTKARRSAGKLHP
jgi:hypothetical protein